VRLPLCELVLRFPRVCLQPHSGLLDVGVRWGHAEVARQCVCRRRFAGPPHPRWPNGFRVLVCRPAYHRHVLSHAGQHCQVRNRACPPPSSSRRCLCLLVPRIRPCLPCFPSAYCWSLPSVSILLSSVSSLRHLSMDHVVVYVGSPSASADAVVVTVYHQRALLHPTVDTQQMQTFGIPYLFQCEPDVSVR
jgi:hypothetical protein